MNGTCFLLRSTLSNAEVHRNHVRLFNDDIEKWIYCQTVLKNMQQILPVTFHFANALIFKGGKNTCLCIVILACVGRIAADLRSSKTENWE